MNRDEHLQRLLKELADGKRREQVCQELGALGDPRCIAPLIQAMGMPATQALKRYGAAAFEPLVAVLMAKNATDNQRQFVADTLRALGDKRAIEPLTRLLKDPNKYVRMSAARSLAGLNDARAADAMAALLHDPAYEVRSIAAHFLHGLGDPRAVDLLFASLHGFTEKNQAIKALADIGAPVLTRLAQALRGTPFGVNLDVVEILGELRVTSEQAIELLDGALDDARGEYPVKRLLQALKQRGWKPRTPRHRVFQAIADGRWQDTVIEGEAAFAPLCAMLDGNREQPRPAAVPLGQLGDPRAIKPLLSAALELPYATADAVRALERLLGVVAAQVSDEELAQIAQLPAQIGARQVVGGEESYTVSSIGSTVDLRSLKEFARAELARRGIRDLRPFKPLVEPAAARGNTRKPWWRSWLFWQK